MISFGVVLKAREHRGKANHYGMLWRMVDKLGYMNITSKLIDNCITAYNDF